MQLQHSMDIYELLFDSSRRTADVAAGLVGSRPELFEKMLEFTLREEKPFAQRGSRVIYLCAHNHPELIRPHLKGIIKDFNTYKDESLKRNFAKLLTEFVGELDENSKSILIGLSFEWVLSPSEKVAMKIYGLDILYNLTKLYPELKSELISYIKDQIPKSSIAFKSKGNKLLKKLYTEMK